jgi:hypothetical protein
MHAGRFGDAGSFLGFVKELLDRICGYGVILFCPVK